MYIKLVLLEFSRRENQDFNSTGALIFYRNLEFSVAV